MLCPSPLSLDLTLLDVNFRVLLERPSPRWCHLLPAICRCVRRAIATTAAHELSPVCAVVGGLFAQDILKALAAREPPIANFFTFDGNLGGGTVVRMSMP